MHDIFAQCETIARVAHTGQLRADGVHAYFIHPRGVVDTLALQRHDLGLNNSADYANAICAAWLHDVVEDCSINGRRVVLGDLADWHVPQTVVHIVDLLTKPDDGPARPEYYLRIQTSRIAMAVKYADRLYNLTDATIEVRNGRSVTKWEKYAMKTRRDVLPMYNNGGMVSEYVFMHGRLEQAVAALEQAVADHLTSGVIVR